MSKQDTHASTFNSYLTGFLLSVALTVVAFFMVAAKIFSGRVMMYIIVGLAVEQLLVQLVFFLHLHKESKPRWNLFIMLFMLLILAIVVIGSLWIMHHLNYNMMPEHEMDSYMIEESGKGF